MLKLKDKPIHEVLFLILSFVMGIVYVIAGGVCYVYKDKLQILPTDMQNILAITIILYGFFRMYRVYHQAKS